MAKSAQRGEVVVVAHDARLFERPEPVGVAFRRVDDRVRQRVQQLGCEQHTALARHGRERRGVALVVEVLERGEHLRLRERTDRGVLRQIRLQPCVVDDDGLVRFLAQRQDSALDALERLGGHRRGLGIPGDEAADALGQLVEPFAGLGARDDVVVDTARRHEFLDVLGREGAGPAIRSRGHDDDGPAPAELPEPGLDGAQRVGVTGRIEQHERKIRVVEEQRVRQPVTRAGGEIPQDGLAVRAVLAHVPELIDSPESLPVAGGVLDVRAAGE